MNMFETTRIIKKEQKKAYVIRIIILTANAGFEEKEKSFQAAMV